jgi:hypothetical protein
MGGSWIGGFFPFSFYSSPPLGGFAQQPPFAQEPEPLHK